MTPGLHKKIIASVLILLLVVVSLAYAVPVIAPPSVSTQGTQQGSQEKAAVSAAGPYVPSFLQSPDMEIIESEVVGTDTIDLTEQEKLNKEMSSQDVAGANGIGTDELSTDTAFYSFGTLSSGYRNWNTVGSLYWTFRWTGSNRWGVFHLKAPKPDLDLRLFRYYSGAYRQVAVSSLSSSNDMIAYPLYYNNYYRLYIYRYGSPGYQTAYIYRYSAV